MEQLIEQAYESLAACDLRAARRKGQKLIKMHHTSGFEIVAHTYQMEGDLDQALATVRQGLDVAPQVWPLWLQLGQLLSSGGRFDEEQAAYEQALGCPDVDVATVRVSQAVGLSRQGQDEKALEVLRAITSECAEDPELSLLRCGLEVSVLGHLGQWPEAESVARQGLEQVTDAQRESHPDAVAQLHVRLAEVLWRGRQLRDEALAEAWKAVHLSAADADALSLIRDLEGRPSPDAHRFQLTVLGFWHEPLPGDEKPPRFYRNYLVVADSPAHALALVTPFQPEPVRESLVIEDSQDLGPAPDELSGVLRQTGCIFFPDET